MNHPIATLPGTLNIDTTLLESAWLGTPCICSPLLCADARLAVEADGGLHLADPVAYRRDRRKDQLLQESGYLVLRFLAEDLGKELDAVLDSILCSLTSRRAAIVSVQPLHLVRSG